MAQKKRLRAWIFRLLALGISSSVVVVAAEVVLRLTREKDRFYPYHQNATKVSYPHPERTPGVSGPSYFTTNSFGCRGPELSGEQHRLLVVGGSTAACTALDDGEEWAHLVMSNVNEWARDETFLWVTNSGIDGKNSRHHLMHAKFLVPKIPELDHVLIYMGLNDVGAWIYHEHFDPDYLEKPKGWDEALAQSFRVSNHTSSALPWYKHLELWKRASVIKANWLSASHREQQAAGAIVQDERLEWLEAAQQRRNEREHKLLPRAKVDTMPVALEAYARNIQRIIDLVREAGAEPIFMTQLIMWHGLSEEDKSRLWMGGDRRRQRLRQGRADGEVRRHVQPAIARGIREARRALHRFARRARGRERALLRWLPLQRRWGPGASRGSCRISSSETSTTSPAHRSRRLLTRAE